MSISKQWFPGLCLFIFSACTGQQIRYQSPRGYDLTRPETFVMPDVLHEISGIGFKDGNSDVLYTEQDEEGRVYYLRLGDKQARSVKFGKRGDFEDITLVGDLVVMLRSDGVLFSFPFSGIAAGDIHDTREWTGLLPPGEYEGLYGDAAARLVYVLCKHCGGKGGGYVFRLDNDSTLRSAGDFNIDTKGLRGKSDRGFHPSALTKNDRTNEWYILSSVNKLLVVTDVQWRVKAAYPLNPAVFNQPEGIAFDRDGNLYISNEGGVGGKGNVLKFTYRP